MRKQAKRAINPEGIRTRLQQRIEACGDPDNLRMTTDETAVYVPMSKGQLAQLRFAGKGPKFLKPTERTVLYRKKDIDEWLNASVRTSTAEVSR